MAYNFACKGCMLRTFSSLAAHSSTDSYLRKAPSRQNMATQTVYSALPLDHPRKQIRLLEIIATSPQICCTLRTASLLDDPTFCAMSYVWGSPSDPQDIVVNNVSFSVTKSLADALSNVQIHWQKAYPDRKPAEMRLWADAICINQCDRAEKGHQVPLMKSIYSSAQLTFCSLDSISTTSRIPLAIDCISEISARLDVRDHATDFKEQDVGVEVLDNLAPTPLDHTSTQEPEKAKKSVVGDIPEFLFVDLDELPYWRRAWIFQELVLSREILLFYADRSLEFRTLARVTNWAKEMRTAVRSASMTLATYWKIRTLARFFTVGQVQYIRKILAERNDVTMYTPFLGLTGLNVEPQYDEKTSVATVFIDFCVAQMRTPGITFQSPLRFLAYADLASGNPGEHGLPTWVPNFPACAEAGGCRLIKSLHHSRGEEPVWENLIGLQENVYIRDRSLLTTSLHIDTIRHCSPVLRNSQGSADFLRPVYEMLRHIFEAVENPWSNNSHPFFKLSSAFWQARIPSPFWKSDELLRVGKMFLLLHNIASTTRSDYPSGFLNFQRNTCFDFVGLENPETILDVCAFAKNLLDRKFMEDPDNWLSTWDDIYSFMELGIRVARTARNEFAILPPEALAGDQIVLLTGHERLSLIRKEENHYVYVGTVGEKGVTFLNDELKANASMEVVVEDLDPVCYANVVTRGGLFLTAHFGFLLGKGVGVDDRVENGYTSPMRAASARNTIMPPGVAIRVSLSLSSQKEPISNLQGRTGATALINASEKGNVSIVSFLLEKGADPDVRDDLNCTALMTATKKGHQAVNKPLIENGEQFTSIQDPQGYTALDLALRGEQIAITDLLIKQGAIANMYAGEIDFCAEKATCYAGFNTIGAKLATEG
ncbi:hypothetical protein NM208_g5585 [Fusarium decemcellulare]|uniref:Uncharacterized protein n=1 Tax=Fusarium decemcellulare TaxID=57161 RepID=A0ACC1SGC0_9HYPO|nr:hypothetical protein NM208_g5585 [Fusarium decemcellulare]